MAKHGKKGGRKLTHPVGTVRISTIHAKGKPGRRFNSKTWATIGAYAVGIQGRLEGDGGQNPWSKKLETWKNTERPEPLTPSGAPPSGSE